MIPDAPRSLLPPRSSRDWIVLEVFLAAVGKTISLAESSSTIFAVISVPFIADESFFPVLISALEKKEEDASIFFGGGVGSGSVAAASRKAILDGEHRYA